jgi:mannose-6-phosphate isomerase-like protein (cupin superfamily)
LGRVPGEKVYFVLDGEVTIRTKSEEIVVLKRTI